MSLTLDDVHQVRFRMTRRGETGYQVGDVDTFIDKVEETFDQFEKERERHRAELESMQATSVQSVVADGPAHDDSELRRSLEAKDGEIASLRAEVERLSAGARQDGDASAAQAAAEQRVRELHAENADLRSQLEQQRNQLEQVRGEFDRVRSERVTAAGGGVQQLTVAAAEDAAPAVTRLLQMATEQATSLVSEAQTEAERKLSEAEARANEIKTDARTKADRIESEARVNAEMMTREAEHRAADVDRQASERRTELFADLEREQGELRTVVERLRGFESDFRGNLNDSLQRFQALLEQAPGEPQDVPESAQPRQSGTPRLDALAGGDQQWGDEGHR